MSQNLNVRFVDCNNQPITSKKILFTPTNAPRTTASYLSVQDSQQFTTDNSGSISGSVVAGLYSVTIANPKPETSCYLLFNEESSSLYSGSNQSGSTQNVLFNLLEIDKDLFGARKVTITPSRNYPTNFSASIMALNSTSSITDVSGAVTFASLIPGVYQVDCAGKVVTTFHISVPALPSTGAYAPIWNAHELLVVTPAKATKVSVNNADNSYVLTVSASDARYAYKDGTLTNADTASYVTASNIVGTVASSSTSISSSYASIANFASSSSVAESSSVSLTASYVYNTNTASIDAPHINFRSASIDKWGIHSNGHLIPATNNAYNVGSNTNHISTLHAEFATVYNAIGCNSLAANDSITATRITASLKGTASVAITASHALVADWASIAESAEISNLAITSSYAKTASVALVALNANTASYVATASNANTASYIANVSSASYARTATTASYLTDTDYNINDLDARNLTINRIGLGGSVQGGVGSIAASGDGTAVGFYSFVQGTGNSSTADYSHAQGDGTTSTGNASHAEGRSSVSSGHASHAEGNETNAVGYVAHSEGIHTLASGSYSHAEGSGSVAKGEASHAEGDRCTAYGDHSHAEGDRCESYGENSHAEGQLSVSSGSNSHAEGQLCITRGSVSHAEGYSTITVGDFSHAEGSGSVAVGVCSHAQGNQTIASGSFQTVMGKFNTRNNTSALVIIGNGGDDGDREDLALFNTGNIQFNKPLTCSYVNGTITNAVSASYALSASYAPGGTTTPTYTVVTTGSTNWVTMSFATENQYYNLTVSQSLNFTCSNLPSNNTDVKDITLFIKNTAAWTSSLSFPSSWVNLGGGWPTSITSSKCAMVTLRTYGTSSIVGTFVNES
jgi:hypothetical protein